MTEPNRAGGRPSVDEGLSWLESVREPTPAQLTAMRVLRNMAGKPFLSRAEDVARAAAMPPLPAQEAASRMDHCRMHADEEVELREVAEHVEDGEPEFAM